jgi:hypothetical protein
MHHTALLYTLMHRQPKHAPSSLGVQVQGMGEKPLMLRGADTGVLRDFVHVLAEEDVCGADVRVHKVRTGVIAVQGTHDDVRAAVLALLQVWEVHVSQQWSKSAPSSKKKNQRDMVQCAAVQWVCTTSDAVFDNTAYAAHIHQCHTDGDSVCMESWNVVYCVQSGEMSLLCKKDGSDILATRQRSSTATKMAYELMRFRQADTAECEAVDLGDADRDVQDVVASLLSVPGAAPASAPWVGKGKGCIKQYMQSAVPAPVQPVVVHTSAVSLPPLSPGASVTSEGPPVDPHPPMVPAPAVALAAVAAAPAPAPAAGAGGALTVSIPSIGGAKRRREESGPEQSPLQQAMSDALCDDEREDLHAALAYAIAPGNVTLSRQSDVLNHDVLHELLRNTGRVTLRAVTLPLHEVILDEVACMFHGSPRSGLVDLRIPTVDLPMWKMWARMLEKAMPCSVTCAPSSNETMVLTFTGGAAHACASTDDMDSIGGFEDDTDFILDDMDLVPSPAKKPRSSEMDMDTVAAMMKTVKAQQEQVDTMRAKLASVQAELDQSRAGEKIALGALQLYVNARMQD